MATNRQKPNEINAKKLRMPAAMSAATSTIEATPGHMKFRRRLSVEVRRHANNGPTPVRNNRNNPIGIMSRLNHGGSKLIFSPVTASEITGNSVPHNTAKQLASRTRLLNRKLDSRETTDSSCASLFKYGSRSRIR